MIKMIGRSQDCFYLAFLQIMMHQIHLFWILPSHKYLLLNYLTSLLLIFESFEHFRFFNTYVKTTVSDGNWMLLFFFYYCHYCFSLFLFCLVLFFIKWLYNELLNFSLCKYISSHPRSIYSKLVILLGALLFTLSISFNKSMLLEIPGTKHLTYLVIVDFTFKTFIRVC